MLERPPSRRQAATDRQRRYRRRLRDGVMPITVDVDRLIVSLLGAAHVCALAIPPI
jgi:hypothetical protein